MKKTLEIEIKLIGHAEGTLGWLLNKAHKITLGVAGNGCLGAWLVDKDDSTITCLAMRGYWDHDPSRIATAHSVDTRWVDNEPLPPSEPTSDQLTADGIPWTLAAWATVCEMGDRAAELIQKKLDDDDAVDQLCVVARGEESV
ncbi:MAG: hypothetical protein ACYTEQ_29665 [Planctomycetota bacterium]|jgi:hypothetical protein